MRQKIRQNTSIIIAVIILNYTVYVDVLFLLNIIVDTLILTSTAIITGQKIYKWRLIIASALGALYSTLIFFPSLSILKLIILKITISIIITVVAFKFKNIVHTFKNLVTFYLLSMLYGGGIYAFYSLTPSASKINFSNGIYYIDLPLWLILTLSFGYYFFVKYALKIIDNRSVNQTIRNVEITILNNTISLNALYDSGNTLYDPITMTPVMIVESKCFKNILSDSLINFFEQCDSSSLLKIHEKYPTLCVRLIPYNDISNTKKSLIAIKPQKIFDIEGNKEINNTLVAITTAKLSVDNSYNALLHSKAR